MTDSNKFSPSPDTLLAQAMGAVDPATRALAPPVHPATTFERAPDGTLPGTYSYIRDGAPGLEAPESMLTHLEGAADAALFSSGMAAATALFLALEPGARVVAPDRMYWGLRAWLSEDASRHGIKVATFAVAPEPETTARALRDAVAAAPTALVWIETPANPTWEVTDIAGAAAMAHEAGALLAVDSTVPTPLLTQPIALGADLVTHSATKYLNGHSDVLAGALVTARRDGMWARVRRNRVRFGAALGGFESWLLLRGLRTLHLRVARACANAQAVAEHFAADSRLAAVLYPGLPGDPGHGAAARQMRGGFGGMLSLRVAGGEEAAARVLSRVQLWKRATSLGGVESLIEHRACIEGADSPAPRDLLRLSAGIESADDLISDLDQALA